MPNAARRLADAKKLKDAIAKRHANGQPPLPQELTRLRALREAYFVLIKVHTHLVQSRVQKDNVMHWTDAAIGGPMRRKFKLSDDHRYSDLSGQFKCLIGTSSMAAEKYKYALKNHPETMQMLGEYSVFKKFLMCPGGEWKNATWPQHKAAMLEAGLTEAGLQKFDLTEETMCLGHQNRLESRDLYAAQFDHAVLHSGFDFAGIGSPFDTGTKKRKPDGAGAGGEDNSAVGKHPVYSEKKEKRPEERKPTPFKVAPKCEFPKPKPKKKSKVSMHGDSGTMQQFLGGLNAKRAQVEVKCGKPGKPISIGSFAASHALPGHRHVPGVAPNNDPTSKERTAPGGQAQHQAKQASSSTDAAMEAAAWSQPAPPLSQEKETFYADLFTRVRGNQADIDARAAKAPPKPHIEVHEIFDDSPEKKAAEGLEDSASPKCKKGLGLAGDGDDDDDADCFSVGPEDGADEAEELEEQRLNAPSPEPPSPNPTLPPSPGLAKVLADGVSYKSKEGIGGFRVPVGPMGNMLEGQAVDVDAAAGGGGGYSDGSADDELEQELKKRSKASARSKAFDKEKFRHNSLMSKYKGARGNHVRPQGDDRMEQRGKIMADRAEKKEVPTLTPPHTLPPHTLRTPHTLPHTPHTCHTPQGQLTFGSGDHRIGLPKHNRSYPAIVAGMELGPKRSKGWTTLEKERYEEKGGTFVDDNYLKKGTRGYKKVYKIIGTYTHSRYPVGNKDRYMLRYYDFTKHGGTVPTEEDEMHVSPLHEIVGWVQLFGKDVLPRNDLEAAGGSRS
jgi:hypothetical protein